MISLVVAMDKNRVIGLNNHLPWRLPNDLKRFKEITLGKPVVMGRATHESIGRPLPGRRNIVLSRDPAYLAQGCETASSLEAALNTLQAVEEVMIIGGASIYESALPICTRMYVTLIEEEYVGDTWFPWYDKKEWEEMSMEEHPVDETHDVPFTFLLLERRKKAFQGINEVEAP